MDWTPHVMLAGEGAARFAAAQKLAAIADEAAWFTRAGQDESNHPPGTLAHGTVGCVVRDREGRLAAATSTGGVFGKLPGRVGDSPRSSDRWRLGRPAGWRCPAPARASISCASRRRPSWRTGCGSAASRWPRPRTAVLAEIRALGGEGGLIAVDAEGNVAMPFVSAGMKRAALHAGWGDCLRGVLMSPTGATLAVKTSGQVYRRKDAPVREVLKPRQPLEHPERAFEARAAADG
jgi:beta-aspartyl-peptidase (threonine type)